MSDIAHQTWQRCRININQVVTNISKPTSVFNFLATSFTELLPAITDHAITDQSHIEQLQYRLTSIRKSLYQPSQPQSPPNLASPHHDFQQFHLVLHSLWTNLSSHSDLINTSACLEFVCKLLARSLYNEILLVQVRVLLMQGPAGITLAPQIRTGS